jgi:hypothetical protein
VATGELAFKVLELVVRAEGLSESYVDADGERITADTGEMFHLLTGHQPLGRMIGPHVLPTRGVPPLARAYLAAFQFA